MQPLPLQARIDIPQANHANLSYHAQICPILQQSIAALIQEHFLHIPTAYLLAEAEDTRSCRKGNCHYSDGKSMLALFKAKQQFVMPTYNEACAKVHFHFVYQENNRFIKKHYATYTSYEEALYDFDHIPFKGDENATIKARGKLLLHLFQNDYDTIAKIWIDTWRLGPSELLPSPFSTEPFNEETIERFLAIHRRQQLKEKVIRACSLALGSITNVLLYRFLPVSYASAASFVINAALFANRIDKFFNRKALQPIDHNTQLASIGFSGASIVHAAVKKPFEAMSVGSSIIGGFSLITNLGLRST